MISDWNTENPKELKRQLALLERALEKALKEIESLKKRVTALE